MGGFYISAHICVIYAFLLARICFRASIAMFRADSKSSEANLICGVLISSQSFRKSSRELGDNSSINLSLSAFLTVVAAECLAINS